MTVTGTLANLSAALTGLNYVPGSGYTGNDSLQLTLNDSLTNLQGTANTTLDVITLTAPSVSGPTNVGLTQNGSYTFASGAIVLTDIDAINNTVDSLSLAVSKGTLKLGSTSGITFSAGANGASSMTITGTLTSLNAALSGLVYTSTTGFSGHDTLSISVTDTVDSLKGTGSVGLSVNPFVTAPATASMLGNTSLTFSNASLISVTDGGAVGTSDSVTLTVSDGKLALGSTSGITFGSGANNSSSMTISGTLANLNLALSGLIYTPTANYSGSDTLHVSLLDSGDSLSGSAAVAITVNAAPSVTAPTSVNVLENASTTFSTSNGAPITFTDTAASGTSDQLTLSVLDGKLTLGATGGITVLAGGNGTSSMTITGTLANLNAAVNGLVYVPRSGFTGTDTLSISVKDTNDNGIGSAKVSLIVQAKKIIGGFVVAGTVNSSPSASSTASVSPDTQTTQTTPNDQTTQWAGVSAAVEVLNG
jgi:hypothetical protein